MNDVLTALAALQARFFSTDDERGATATEYALLLAFIAVVIIVGITALGNNLLSLFSNSASSV